MWFIALPPQDVPELLVSGRHGAKCRVRTSVWFNAWTQDFMQLFGTDRVRGGKMPRTNDECGVLQRRGDFQQV